MEAVYKLAPAHYGYKFISMSVALIMMTYFLIIITQNIVTAKVTKDYYFNLPLLGVALVSSFYFLPGHPRRAILLFTVFMFSTLLTILVFRKKMIQA